MSARRPSPQQRNRERALSPTQSTSRRNNTLADPSLAAAQTKYAKFLRLQQQQQQQRPFTSSLKGKYQIAAREKSSVGSGSPPPPLHPQPQPLAQPHSATSSSANNIKIARRESASTRAQELVAVSQGRSSPGLLDHHAHAPLYAPSSSSAAAAASSVSPTAEPLAGSTRPNVSQLRKKSVRWLNLTSTFWCLAVQDAQRSVDCAALTSFLEAMEWRARGKITDAEFTAIYAEWIGGHNAQSTRRRGAIGVFAVRQLLQERSSSSCEESDLDLLIGMIIHENNRALLGTPVSFAGGGNNKARGGGGLEVVTPRWLTLSEELFFVLDTPGYGSLRFDEVFFLSTCLVIGLQGWATEGQMAADLSLEILGAHALQLMKDMGCTVTITAHRQELLGLSISRDPDDTRERSTAHLLDETAADVEPLSDATLLSGRVLSPGRASISGRMVATPSFGKFCVTLPMFKAFLVRRGVGEKSLGDLLVHVRTCVERLAHVALSGRGASSSSSQQQQQQQQRDLYLALHPAALGLGESTLGSPRLWQKTVISAAGFDLGSAAAAPPILSFLLSDAERLIPGAVRCAEGLQQRPKSAMLLSEADELHETARRLWAAFRIWGAALPAGAAAASSDPRSDPTFQLVLTSLLEYKASQRGLCRALLDLAMAHFGLGAATSSVAPVCLALLPTVDTILVELGMDEGDEGAEAKAPSSPPSRPSNMRTPHPHSPTYPSGRFSATALQMQQVQAAMAPATEEEVVPARGRAGPPASSAGAGLGVATGGEGSRAPSPQRERGPAVSNAGGAAAGAVGRPAAPLDASSGSVPRRRSRGALGGLATPFTPYTPYTPLATPAGLDNTASSIRPDRAPGGWYDETPLAAPMRREGSGLPPQAPPASARTAGRGSIAPPPQTPGAVLSAQEAELFQSLLQAREPSSQRDLLVQLRAIRGLPGQAPPSDRPSSLPLPPRPPSLPATQAAPEAAAQSVPPAPPSVAPTAVTDETTPSSLEDLLEMGHGAGRYAQTLREILRKMSRDNNRVQLHSLEQVLKLGQQIAVLEKERPARQMRSRSPPARSPEPRDARGSAKGSGATPGTAFGRGTGARLGPGAGAERAYVQATPSSSGRAAWGGERPRHQALTPRVQPPPAEKPYLVQAAQAVTRAARRAAPGTTPLPKRPYNRGFG